MAKGPHQINNYLEILFSNQSLAELREKISPSSGESYPSIVSLKGVTRWLKDGDWVEIDGRRGIVPRIPAPENSFREGNSDGK